MLWIILTVLALIATILLYIIYPHQYWITRGVQQGNPVPILGVFSCLLLGTHSSAEMIEMVYNIAPCTKRYLGIYQFNLPTLVLKDPDLIKQITVKDCDHFMDHRPLISKKNDPLWSKNLFSLTGQRWRAMRDTLTPAFTSSKMKGMFQIVLQIGEQFIDYFLAKNENVITVEMKDVCTRFTNDVIANGVFGVECDSLKERTNRFYVMGREATDLSGIWTRLKFLGYFFVPKLFNLFRIPLFSLQVTDFFCDLVKESIKSRKEHGIVRPDMIHLLLEAQKQGNNLKTEERLDITDEDIAAQALLFFLAGFESVSTLMCFMAHELAVNSDVQYKLLREVDETRAECNGKLTYDVLHKMKYMDMVVSESMRKWPPLLVDRICTKPYTIQPKYSDERPVHLEKNDLLWVPIYAIHRDPNNYPEPERFLPERFTGVNKNIIKSYTYFPFGSGPRHCIGWRFALLETKLLFFHILSHFKIIPVEKTQIPLKLTKNAFNMNAEKGFWLGLQRRNMH